MSNNLISISQLLTEGKYLIPLYQRNFSWTEKEITQLIIDILDSINSSRPEYYIGTLVISNNETGRSIIDGQQRCTAILLMALAIQNDFKGENIILKRNLYFTARKLSNKTLDYLFDKNENDSTDELEDELYRGYNESVDLLKEHIDTGDYAGITISAFYSYLLNNVKIFINKLPSDLDVNLYFERFNSRGEQLESHEIIKAELMQKLLSEGTNWNKIQKFAKVWDACADFETPCIKYFKKKQKGLMRTKKEKKCFYANGVNMNLADIPGIMDLT
jgi:uncharacterized protein with ParB-like and HNH nuclease domain